jgi:hypothetical protein
VEHRPAQKQERVSEIQAILYDACEGDAFLAAGAGGTKIASPKSEMSYLAKGRRL